MGVGSHSHRHHQARGAFPRPPRNVPPLLTREGEAARVAAWYGRLRGLRLRHPRAAEPFAVDPLPAGFAATEVIPDPREVRSIQAVV